MDYSVVLFDLKTEGAPSEKPLMLQPVLFCPVLTWVTNTPVRHLPRSEVPAFYRMGGMEGRLPARDPL